MSGKTKLSDSVKQEAAAALESIECRKIVVRVESMCGSTVSLSVQILDGEDNAVVSMEPAALRLGDTMTLMNIQEFFKVYI